MKASASSPIQTPEDLFARFQHRAIEVPGGAILIPRRPVRVTARIRSFFRSGQMLLEFEWMSIGPMSSFAGLSLATAARQTYALFWAEDQPSRLIACLKPRATRQMVSAFFRTLLEKEGAAYHFTPFGGLPSVTTNFRQDLLPQPVIRDAYAQWLDWRTDNGCDWENWFLLESGLLSQMVEPDHLSRSLAELRGLKDVFSGGTESLRNHIEMLGERGKESASWAEERKRALMEVFLNRTYRVSDQ
jgi:hypothetical protein